jgi:hypothetical protein
MRSWEFSRRLIPSSLIPGPSPQVEKGEGRREKKPTALYISRLRTSASVSTGRDFCLYPVFISIENELNCVATRPVYKYYFLVSANNSFN